MILHNMKTVFFGKTGILILIYVCAQNSRGIWKIFPVHHQNRQYILLFGTPKTVYWFLQRTLGLLCMVQGFVMGYINIHAIILSYLRKNYWPNFEIFNVLPPNI